jgi:hypothetical protein
LGKSMLKVEDGKNMALLSPAVTMGARLEWPPAWQVGFILSGTFHAVPIYKDSVTGRMASFFSAAWLPSWMPPTSPTYYELTHKWSPLCLSCCCCGQCLCSNYFWLMLCWYLCASSYYYIPR